MPSRLRRVVTGSLRAVISLLILAAPAAAQVAPFPPSPFITGIGFDWASFRRHAEDSDNWPMTWAADGLLYSSWGDGGGVGPDAASRAYVSLGIARLTGDSATTLRATNLIGGLSPAVAQCMQLIPPDRAERHPGRPCFRRGRHGKSWGILARGDQLYLWVVPASAPRFLYSEARVYRARRGTNAWTRADWAFTPSDPVRVVQPTFLQAGRDYADIPDYVYVYAVRHAPVTLDGFSIHRSADGGQIMLMRVPKSGDPLRHEDYEYYAGASAGGGATWTREPAGMRPAFSDPNGVGWTVSAAYVKELGRYLLMTEHTSSQQGLLGIFEGENAWGPWRTVFYGTLTDGTPRVPPRAFFANLVPNSVADGGRRLTLAFTGVDAVDSLNLVDARLTLDEAARRGGPAGRKRTLVAAPTSAGAWASSITSPSASAISRRARR